MTTQRASELQRLLRHLRQCSAESDKAAALILVVKRRLAPMFAAQKAADEHRRGQRLLYTWA